MKTSFNSIYPRKNKQGNVISYRFFYSGKDTCTGKNKQFTMTWKVPQGLTKRELETQKETAYIDFRKECDKKLKGIFIEETNLTFGEYSSQWLERLLKINPDSYSYYAQAKNALKVINPYFGECLLTKITPLMVQRFYDYLCDRTYTKTTVTVKKSIEKNIQDTIESYEKYIFDAKKQLQEKNDIDDKIKSLQNNIDIIIKNIKTK